MMLGFGSHTCEHRVQHSAATGHARLHVQPALLSQHGAAEHLRPLQLHGRQADGHGRPPRRGRGGGDLGAGGRGALGGAAAAGARVAQRLPCGRGGRAGLHGACGARRRCEFIRFLIDF